MYIEPNVSFAPGRISIFNKVLEENGKPFRRPKENTVLPSCNKTNGEVSKKASKNVKDKVNWLVQIAGLLAPVFWEIMILSFRLVHL